MTTQQSAPRTWRPDARSHDIEKYLIPAMDAGLIEMTIPEKPRSSKQKYRKTEAGGRVLTLESRS